MPLLGALGCVIERYGPLEPGRAVDEDRAGDDRAGDDRAGDDRAGDDRAGDAGGFAEATWRPTELACNPFGSVQAGVYGVVTDAVMSFALNAGLAPPDRSGVTIDLVLALLHPARVGEDLVVRATTLRLAGRIGFVEARVHDRAQRLIATSAATFTLERRG